MLYCIEFKLKFGYDGLDSDLLEMEKHYSKSGGGSLWVTGMSRGNNKINNDYFQIAATIVERIQAIRNRTRDTCDYNRLCRKC
jgi:hypothetical protein